MTRAHALRLAASPFLLPVATGGELAAAIDRLAAANRPEDAPAIAALRAEVRRLRPVVRPASTPNTQKAA